MVQNAGAGRSHMTEDDNENQRPRRIRLVSDNPNADAEKVARSVERARGDVRRALAQAAATILRLMAGGEATSYNLRNDMARLALAEEKLRELSGQPSTPWDAHDALKLPSAELSGERSGDRYREWQYERGLELIVQGSLRLAAHQLLDERPHFGGKFSERLIEDGINMRRRAFEPPPPPPKPPTKKRIAEDRAARLKTDDIMRDRLRSPKSPPKRKKPWSSRDSWSWQDPKPEGETE